MTSLDQSLLARLHADLGSLLLNGNAPPPVVVNHHNNRAKETQENAERLRKLQTIVDAMNNNKSEATSSSSIDSSAKPKRSVAEIDADLRALLAAYGTTSAGELEAYMTRFRTEASRLLEERRVSV